MGFMQKRVNAFLLILVLIVAAALAGSSVYFQSTFDKLTNKQDDTAANLSTCKADLDRYKFNLNKTLRSLNTTTQDIRRYDELYTTKDTELKSTQSNLTNTQTTLKQTKISLAEETALKAKYKKDYQDEAELRKSAEEQNTILTAQKAQLESSIINYKQNEDDVENCIIEFLSDYDAGLTQAMKDDVNDCKP
jgi:peptidoglycan hydrolase CwlO-like protein